MVSFMVMAIVYCVGYLGQDWSSSECMLCSNPSLAHNDCASLTVRMLCKVPQAP